MEKCYSVSVSGQDTEHFSETLIVAFEIHLNISEYCSSQLFPQVYKLHRVLRSDRYANSDQCSYFTPPENNRKSKVFWSCQGDKRGTLAGYELRHD